MDGIYLDWVTVKERGLSQHNGYGIYSKLSDFHSIITETTFLNSSPVK